MKRNIAFTAVGVASVVLAVAVAGSALAWHPVGKISKQVQNVTQKSALSEANSAAQAVTAKPGDTLKYVITVRNDGQKHSKGWNDMHFTKVTDVLPAGVTLEGGETNKELGHIAAGASKKYEFTVKVTSQKNGEVICNTAKFTGDSEVKDQPQKGSDNACIKVEVPAKPETPKPVEKMIEICYKDKGPQMHKIKESEFDSKTMSKNPEDCKKPETPKPVEPAAPVEQLPETGPESMVMQVLGLGSTAAAGLAYWRSRR